MRSTTAVRPHTGVREAPRNWRTCWSDGPCGLRKSADPATSLLTSDDAKPAATKNSGQAFLLIGK
jgi:hypothetical protein